MLPPRSATTPATRPEFWAEKFAANVRRDRAACEALAAAGEDGPPYTIVDVQSDVDEHVLYRIEGTFEAPLYLTDPVGLTVAEVTRRATLEISVVDESGAAIPCRLTIVDAAGELMGDPVHFIFLGAGAKRNWLERRVREQKLTNITILDPRPRAEQQEFLNACDVGIVSLVGKMKGVSMPSRTYNILAAGKPILAIAEAGSETALVVEENEIGRFVEPGNVEAFVTAVRDFAAESPELLSGRAGRAREIAERDYSLEKAVSEYRRVLIK